MAAAANHPSAFIEVTEPGGVARSYAVPPAGMRIGRAPAEDVVTRTRTISKLHAELFWRGDDLYLRDAGSRNGTRRDGIPLREPTLLHDGDEVVLGATVVVRVNLHGLGFGAPSSELPVADNLVPVPLPPDAKPAPLDMVPVLAKLFQVASYEELGMMVTRAVGAQLGGSRIALLELDGDGTRYRLVGLHNNLRSDPRPLQDASFVSRRVVAEALRAGVAHFHEGLEEGSASIIRAGAQSAVGATIRPVGGSTYVIYMDAVLAEPPLTPEHARGLQQFAGTVSSAFQTLQARLDAAHERVRFDSLRRYFSPAVVEHILAGRGDAVDRPRNVEATVLFADLVGYTKLSERLKHEPERLLMLLNAWLEAGAGSVIGHGGTLDKFIGDCVMAVFGAPFPQPRAELLAVRCALEMQQAVAALSSREGERLQITVGINSGAMLAGSVGSKRRLEYTVLGDAVNVASRLQGQAKAGEILLGENTAARLHDEVHMEDGGIRAIKNHGPIQAYRVVGLKRPSTTPPLEPDEETVPGSA